MLTRDELEGLIRGGEVDTVLMVFPDLQGRLVGKRTTGRFFLQSVADAGTENCDYLIACDMDNNPVPGYRFTSYAQGYGDMLAKADWHTVRLIPWVPKTAMIMCDLLDVETHELIEVAPRSILQHQVDAAAAMGFLPMVAIFGIFYFLLFLPMQRQKKQTAQMLQNLKKGDIVVTSGGLVGMIVDVNAEDDTIVIKVKPDNVKLQMARSAVASLQNPADAPK